MEHAPASDVLGKLLYVDLKMYLQDNILVKVDRASMACSLEVRAPMLDYRFVELVARLPTSWKLRGMTTKHVFKRAMAPWLPVGITGRSKKGFGIPVADWLRGPLRGRGCKPPYPGGRGGPRFVDPAGTGESEPRAPALGWEWKVFSRIDDHHEQQFLDWIAPAGPEAFRGRVVLEGGCGKGRHT